MKSGDMDKKGRREKGEEWEVGKVKMKERYKRNKKGGIRVWREKEDNVGGGGGGGEGRGWVLGKLEEKEVEKVNCKEKIRERWGRLR
jgi:hypothetical protein